MRPLVLILLVGVLSGLAACSNVNRYPARSPVTTLPSDSCLTALEKLVDIRRSHTPTASLMKATPPPQAALVCIYRGRYGSDPSASRELSRTMKVGAAAAAALADAAAQVSVAMPPAGPMSCPDEAGNITTITFSYAHQAPSSLWWNATGCQSLDNGAIEASQGGSPSFWNFEKVFTRTTGISA